MDISRLISIAEDVGFDDIKLLLNNIKVKSDYDSCPIVLPLVGEFSAGKTSLINSLTDNKQLETATKPTTATIYEIHFGSDRCYAKVNNGDGREIEVDCISNLKNSELSDASYVRVYDTSDKISKTTLLIDTPGLSSSDIRHRQALVNFIPQADGILLSMDINSQLTRSTIDFVNTISLSGRPIYLVLTKCDTKMDSDADKSIKYIEENQQLPFARIIKTSSSTGQLKELYSLLDDIQKEKSKILSRVNEYRIRDIASKMADRLNSLCDSLEDGKELDDEIKKQHHQLRKVTESINRVFDDARTDIELAKKKNIRQFEESVFTKLDSLVANKNTNFDSEAIAIINNSASIALNSFKDAVSARLISMSRKAEGVNLSLTSLNQINLSDLSLKDLSYNLNLNELGHEYDKKISGGLKFAAAIGAVVATVGIASGATGTVVAEETAAGMSTLKTIDTVTDVADTVSDVGSIISNQRNVKRIQGLIHQTQNEYDSIDQTQLGIGQRFGTDKGIVESLVGLVTDGTLAKPQRRRAIHEYLDGNLIPTFKSEIDRMSSEIIASVKQAIDGDLALGTQEMSSVLESLKQAKAEKEDAYKQRVSAIRKYQHELSTI